MAEVLPPLPLSDAMLSYNRSLRYVATPSFRMSAGFNSDVRAASSSTK